MCDNELSRRLVSILRTDTRFGPVVVPSRGTYRSIFAWDSGWNSLWLEKLSPDEAAAELITLFRTADADGRIAHETVFDDEGGYGLIRRLQLLLLRKTFDEKGTSYFIDPPVYIWAAARLLKKASLGAEDRDFITESALRTLNWLGSRRTVKDLPEPFSSLPLLIHPLESGTDLSPGHDSAYGGLLGLIISVLTIPGRIGTGEWELDGRLPKNPAVLLFDLTFLSFYLLSLSEFDRLSTGLAAGFMSEFYNPDRQAFDSYHLRRGRLKRTANHTFSSVLPFLADICDHDTGAAAVERHCLKGGTFRRGPLPSYNDCDTGRRSRHLWRGSCSWMNMNYCCWLLLRKYGFADQAEELAGECRAAVAGDSLPEFFDAFTLAEGGADNFSWNGLVDCMTD